MTPINFFINENMADVVIDRETGKRISDAYVYDIDEIDDFYSDADDTAKYAFAQRWGFKYILDSELYYVYANNDEIVLINPDDERDALDLDVIKSRMENGEFLVSFNIV